MSSTPLTICAVGSSRSCHVQNRVKCFAERGHRVFLITNAISGIPGVTEIVPSVSINLPKLKTFSLFLNFLKAIRSTNADIIHIHYAYDVPAWLPTVLVQNPLVVSVMGGDLPFNEQGTTTRFGRWLTLELLKCADVITAKSNFMMSVLNDLGPFQQKTMKVVWGVDTTHFCRGNADSLRKTLGIEPDERVIFSPRILRPFYNIDAIVAAMPDILRIRPRTKLVLTEYFAYPDYKAKIVEQVRELGIQDRVVFVGHIPHTEMPQYYRMADVAVAIPRADELPQSMLEAMACEVPNVITRLPRLEEFVQHDESVCFTEPNADGVATQITRLLSDEQLHRRIAQNGRTIVQSVASFDKEVDRVEQKYYELHSLPHKRSGYLRRLMRLAAIFLAMKGY